MQIVRYIFANSRSKAERARREFGWAPTHPAADFFANLESEVKLLVEKADAKKGK